MKVINVNSKTENRKPYRVFGYPISQPNIKDEYGL